MLFLTLWEGPSTTVGTGTLGRSCVILIGPTDGDIVYVRMYAGFVPLKTSEHRILRSVTYAISMCT